MTDDLVVWSTTFVNRELSRWRASREELEVTGAEAQALQLSQSLIFVKSLKMIDSMSLEKKGCKSFYLYK